MLGHAETEQALAETGLDVVTLSPRRDLLYAPQVFACRFRKRYGGGAGQALLPNPAAFSVVKRVCFSRYNLVLPVRGGANPERLFEKDGRRQKNAADGMAARRSLHLPAMNVFADTFNDSIHAGRAGGVAKEVPGIVHGHVLEEREEPESYDGVSMGGFELENQGLAAPERLEGLSAARLPEIRFVQIRPR